MMYEIAVWRKSHNVVIVSSGKTSGRFIRKKYEYIQDHIYHVRIKPSLDRYIIFKVESEDIYSDINKILSEFLL